MGTLSLGAERALRARLGLVGAEVFAALRSPSLDNQASALVAAPVTVLTDSSGGTSGDNTIAAVAAITAPAALTDNSGGVSGGNTIAVVTDNASAAAAIATLAAKVNAVITALALAPTQVATRNAVATLAAKDNAVIGSLQAAGVMAPSA